MWETCHFETAIPPTLGELLTVTDDHGRQARVIVIGIEPRGEQFRVKCRRSLFQDNCGNHPSQQGWTAEDRDFLRSVNVKP